MKLKIFLFLALFFSSFSVVADWPQTGCYPECSVSYPVVITVTQAGLIRYGVNNSWTSYRYFAVGSTFSCSDGFWGDPAVGIIKSCQFVVDNCPSGSSLQNDGSCLGSCTSPNVWISALNRCGTPSETCTENTVWCPTYTNNQQTVTGSCKASTDICLPSPDCSLQLGTSLDTGSNVCKKVCSGGQVNDPANPLACVCPAGQTLNGSTCGAPRPDYCSSAFSWDGVNCSFPTASSSTKTVTPAPTPENPNPTPLPSQTGSTTATSSVTNSDGTITTTSVVTNADGSKTTTVYRAPSASSSAVTSGGITTGCLAGDSCNQSDIKTNTKATADSLKKLTDDLAKQSPSTISGGSYTAKYTKSDKTVSSVFNAFSSSVSNSPVVSSVSGFFTVSATSSSCPVWQTEVMGMSIVIDQQCQPVMTEAIFPMVRIVLTLVFSFYAFRVAFL